MRKKRINQSSNTLEIREISSIVWKRKWIIILPLILVTAGAIGASYTLTPMYESSSIVQVDAPVRRLSELQDVTGSPYGRQPWIDGSDRIKSIYNDIISSKNIRMLNDRLSLGETDEIQMQARANVLRQPNEPFEQAVIRVLHENFKKNVRMRWAASDQIELTVRSTDPVTARDIANNLGDIYIKEKPRQEISQIREDRVWLDNELEKSEKQLAEAIQERTDLEQELLTVQRDEVTMSESNREEVISDIDGAQQQIKELRSEEQTIKKDLLANSSLSKKELSLVKSEQLTLLENDLKDQLALVGDLMVRYRWRDPQIINFRVRLNNTQTSLEKENKRLVDKQFASKDEPTRLLLTRLFNIRANLSLLETQKKYLNSALDKIKSNANRMPVYNARLLELNRKVDAKTVIRDRFRRQQQNLSASIEYIRAISPNRYRIVEPAKLAFGPVYPNRRKITIMGFLLGLIIGAAIVILLELMDNSFRSVDDAEEYLDIPVLGIVPEIEILKNV